MRAHRATVLLVGLLCALQGPSSLSLAGEAAPPCKYEENCDCAVPGVTLRWKAAYCMARSETDDLEHAGVQECLAAADTESLSTLAPCERNAYWKRMLCAVLHPGKEDGAQECLRDPSMMPRIVEAGP